MVTTGYSGFDSRHPTNELDMKKVKTSKLPLLKLLKKREREIMEELWLIDKLKAIED